MYAGHDNLYQEATLFDQAFAAAAQRLQSWLPERRDQRWQLGFRVLAALFVLLATMSLFLGLQHAHTAGAQLVAVLAPAGLLAMTHFLVNQGRPAVTRKAQTDPAVAAGSAVPETDTAPVAVPAQTASPQPASTSPRDFLLAVKDAGVNVRIAKALYTAGIRTPEAVSEQSDETLLAIRGVGPATLKKLRHTFG